MAGQPKMVNIVGGSYDTPSGDGSNAKSLNCYPAYYKEEAKEGSAMIGRPGTELAIDLREDAEISAPCRGIYQSTDGTVWGAYNDWIIRINSSTATFEKVHQIGEGAEDVSFADNGFYLLFCDGATLWSLNLVDDVVTTLNGGSKFPFRKPSKLIYTSGMMICINNDDTVDDNIDVADQAKNWNRFFFSVTGPEGVNDWPAINFYTTQQDADRIVSMEKRQDSLWMFGARSFEVWRPTRIGANPFALAGGSGSEIGCQSGRSVAAIMDQVFWLGSSKAGQGQVFMSSGYSARKISNEGIENELYNMGADANNCVGWTYQQRGHTFYVMNYITADITHVYDLTTGKWFHASTRDATLNIDHRWECVYSAYSSVSGKVYVANYEEPVLLTLDLNRNVEWNGVPLVRERVSPIYWSNLKPLIVDEAVFDFEAGVGTQTGQGIDPQLMVQFSKEGGRPGSWSSERWTSLGKIGQYQWTPAIRRLGYSRKPAIRIRVSDPVQFILQGLRLRFRQVGR